MKLATERVTLHAGVVIVHPEWGIYLGSAMGLGFWSKMDPVGQESAATFDGLLEAKRQIQSWDCNNDPAKYKCVRVFTRERNWATVAECMLSGLDYWDPRTAIDPWLLLGKVVDLCSFEKKFIEEHFTELEAQEIIRLSKHEPKPITREHPPTFHSLADEKGLETGEN